MDLSVIIVNYNVKHFLEQCLHSVYKAVGGLQLQVIVVDNNSVDGSCQMLKEKFPQLTLIENKENTGFSKANNQGIEIATGKYVLLLNPDTVVQEDTFSKCFAFMEEHPNAGSLGVKMIDGKGNFLPESKRALPTPAVSFYKIFGLSSLFPKSKLFGRYHLGYLDKDKTHKIEILPGAFMFMRKQALDEVGLLDETFFMYGEDIDLSYRIIQGGYDNYYFPETAIIHYKGESTKKGSINYVLVFYNAMIIFARKHFSVKNAWLFSVLINIAIYLRASLSVLRRIIRSTITPLMDAAIIYGSFYLAQPLWAKYKFGVPDYYPPEYLLFVVPAYVLLWLLTVYAFGGYERKVPVTDLLKGILTGTVSILLVYALLPEDLRYSRALLMLGALGALMAFFITRLTVGRILGTTRILFKKQQKRIAIVGSPEESVRIRGILDQASINPVYVGLVNLNDTWSGQQYIGGIRQLREIVTINKIDELVFCAREISSQDIIQSMLTLGDAAVEFKIASAESMSVIGSSSINTAGELYVVHLNTLSNHLVRRKKRMFDVGISLLLLILSPVLVMKIKKPLGFFRNIFQVLVHAKSWVGLSALDENTESELATVLPGVVRPIPFTKEKTAGKETRRRLNLLYAKDYKIVNDLTIMLRDFVFLGN